MDMAMERLVSDREGLLERARDKRASAARARRLSSQLLSQADRARLETYAEGLEAEADSLERQAAAAAHGRDSRRPSCR